MMTLQGNNRIRVGLIGLLIVAMVVAVGQSFASVPMLFAKPMYYAHFADAAGAMPGDKVRVSGYDVGQIKSLKIDGDRVKVGFTLGDYRIGQDSRLSIRTDTILGKLETIQQPFADQPEELSKLLSEYPTAINLIGRAGGVYGDFFNFYLCDLSLTLNGLQPGGPVRKVRITKQPTGRCTPQ